MDTLDVTAIPARHFYTRINPQDNTAATVSGKLHSSILRSIILALLLAILPSPPALAASITLTWTAPGDDDDIGTAHEYDIRFANFMITEKNWNRATRVSNAPTPEIAGTTQSITIDNLDSTIVYYFAIKAADEVYNWSPKSHTFAKTFQPDRCIGVVGNIDCDNNELVDIGDLTFLIARLFDQIAVLPCPMEGNIDGQGIIDIGDLTALIDHLFITGTPLPSCP